MTRPSLPRPAQAAPLCLLVIPALVSLSCAAPPAPPPATPPAAVPTVVKAEPPPAPKRNPRLGSFGVDIAGVDPAIKAGDDFFQHAGGGWMARTKIPSDRSRWGMFDELREESDANVRKILEEQMKAGGSGGSEAQKVGHAYASYLDTATIDKKGFEPARKGLGQIARARTLGDIVKLMGRPDMPVRAPIAMEVTFDEKNPDRYIVLVLQSGLGLPDREYYSKQEPKFVGIRTKYEAHIGKVLAMAGDRKAALNARAILALEARIAEHHWPIAERRERDKTYNPRTIAELVKEAPGFPWKAYLDAQGYGRESSVIVAENTAMPKLARLFAQTPVATWKAYLSYHFLRSSADVLPTRLDDEVFDFTGRTLTGQPEQRPRWKRAVSAVNGALGDAVGALYVKRHFRPEAKAAMDELVENLRKAYAARIKAVDWMTPETKRVALEKLAAFRPKIGYPTKWKDYRALEVKAGDAYGNLQRARVWHHEYMRDKLGKPSDREEWFMTPQTVNAYYNPSFNEIVFPAAILQPPFFDAEADPAVNYGGIGGVIGHEMGHGFDDQGAKSDAKGILRTWWGPADIAAFKQRTDALAAQYAAFEPLPGTRVNGRLTLGENIGDLGGLTVAYRAYQLSLGGTPAQVIDSYTGDQRFFFGWAQVWRTLYREEALRNQVLTDPHSPAMYRVNGVVRNMDEWYTAFNVKKGDRQFLQPESRVRNLVSRSMDRSGWAMALVSAALGLALGGCSSAPFVELDGSSTPDVLADGADSSTDARDGSTDASDGSTDVDGCVPRTRCDPEECRTPRDGCQGTLECGECTEGRVCGGDFRCGCPAATPDSCTGYCADFQNDAANCGACGHDCLGGSCARGWCQPVAIADGLVNPTALAFFNGEVYFVNEAADDSGGAVQKVSATATATTPTLLAGSQNIPVALSVDRSGVYYVTRANGQVRSVPHAGGTPIDHAAGQEMPSGVSTDPTHVFWVTSVASGAVMRRAKDGVTPAEMVASSQDSPVALAASRSHVYWLNTGDPGGSNFLNRRSGEVRRLALGQAATTLASGQQTPAAMAQDAFHIYWVNRAASGTVMRVRKDGTGVPQTLASDVAYPAGIAMDQSLPVLYFTASNNPFDAATPAGGGRLFRLAL